MPPPVTPPKPLPVQALVDPTPPVRRPETPSPSRSHPPVPAPGAETLLDQLPAALCIVDVVGRYLWSNEVFDLLLGATPGALTGRTMWEFCSQDERELPISRNEARRRGEPVPSAYEMRLRRLDGEWMRVELEPRLLDGGSTLLQIRDLGQHVRDAALVAALAELAARVQRERTVDAVIRAAADGLVALGFRSAVLSLSEEGRMVEVRHVARMDGAMQAVAARLGRPLAGLRFARERLLPPFEKALSADRIRVEREFMPWLSSLLPTVGSEPPPVLPGYRQAAFCPLRVRERVWGTLVLTAERISPSDAAALGLFCSQVSSALEVSDTIEELGQSNMQLAAAFEVGRVSLESEMGRLLPQLLRVMAAVSDGDCADIYLADGDSLGLHGTFGEALGRVVERFPRLPFEAAPTDDLATLCAGESPLFGGPDSWHGTVGEALRAAGVRQFGAFPLVAGGRLLGIVHLARLDDRPFTALDVRGGELVAAQIAIQLEKTRLLNKERRRAGELRALFEVSQTITSSLDVQRIARHSVGVFTRLIPDTVAWLWLITPEGDEVYGVAVSAEEHQTFFERHRLGFTEPSLAAHVLHTRQAERVEDCEHSPLVNPLLAQRFGVKSLLGVPLLVGDVPIGAVTVGDRSRHRKWTEDEVERASIVAATVAVAMANARHYDDLVRSNESLQKAQAQLVERERLAALGELAAVVAHEVRNPLGVIFNSLGALRRATQLEGIAADCLRMVGEEADRLNRIVGDLLDFARPYQLELRAERVETVLQTAAGAVRLAQPDAPPVEVNVEPTLGAAGLDARLFHQALVNLISNAVQASPRSPVQLSARRETRTGGRSWLVIDIADQGPGIAPEQAARIFQPFFTTKATGTGLGLAVVKRIVASHGGDVELHATPGGGATFRLVLPWRPELA